MSALGQRRTFAVQNVMSALPPKADITLTLDADAVPERELLRHIAVELK